jgi:neutral ceramidase
MTLQAGFGAAVITPSVPCMLAGFGDRHEPATSVHDDLEARALVLTDGTDELCLIVCDLLGMSAEFADPVRAAVGAAFGLPRAAVLTACVHTHAGPSALAGAEALGWPTPDGYLDVLVDGCVAAATAAHASRADASLHFTRAPLPAGLSINRRGLPYDPSFCVLDVRAPDGARLGVLANVAIHPVALGPECLAVSSDWVGPFRTTLEALTGGRAMLLSGPLGDVNPRVAHTHPDEGGSFEEARTLGEDVAAAVHAVLSDTVPIGDDLGVAAHRAIEVPVSPTPLAMLTGAGETMAVELVEWRLGDALLLSIPGEAFSAFGQAVLDARGEEVVLAGLSPVWQGYLPMPFGEGYEETVSYGAPAVGAILAALTGASGQ